MFDDGFGDIRDARSPPWGPFALSGAMIAFPTSLITFGRLPARSPLRERFGFFPSFPDVLFQGTPANAGCVLS